MLQIVATVGLKQLTEKALESYHDKSLYTKARNWRRLFAESSQEGLCQHLVSY